MICIGSVISCQFNQREFNGISFIFVSRIPSLEGRKCFNKISYRLTIITKCKMEIYVNIAVYIYMYSKTFHVTRLKSIDILQRTPRFQDR